MNELDRWVDLQGPPPEGVRELLDALVPPMSPELSAELDARVYAAIAEDRRREAQRTKLKWAAAGIAAAAVLVFGWVGAVLFAYRQGWTHTEPAALHRVNPSFTAGKAPDAGRGRR